MYEQLILSEKLHEHLAEAKKTFTERMEKKIPQMAGMESVTESLRSADQIIRVGKMNSIRRRAEKTILAELIDD